MGKVILFAQQKGGAGKTTLLTQLAAYRAAGGATVALIDLDPQRSTAAWAAERAGRPRAGAAIALIESADWRAASDIGEAARRHDLVLVDAPGTADVLGRGAMRAADFVLIPCQPSMPDVWASAATLEMVRKERRPHAVVLNRFPPRGRAAEAAVAALREAGAPVLEPQIGARAAFADAFARGAGVTEIAASSKASREIAALAAALAAAMR